jgi:pyrophosphatase PpaX
VRFQAVLFDLDGTLIDSGAIILASMKHATRTVLKREIPDDELLARVGSSLVEEMRAFDESRVDELVRVYREHNEPLHSELQPCPGVLELLPKLEAEGRRLGIVTAKRRATVELAFAVLPLRDYFDVLVTAEDTERHKPHPEPLLLALERLDMPADATVYVGDSPFDVRAAKAAGIAAIAVSWGRIHSAERLAAEAPDALVHDPEELLAVI